MQQTSRAMRLLQVLGVKPESFAQARERAGPPVRQTTSSGRQVETRGCDALASSTGHRQVKAQHLQQTHQQMQAQQEQGCQL